MKIGEDGDGRARWITPDDRARGRQFREVYLLRGSRRLGRPSCRTSRRHLRDRRFAFLLETSFRRTTEQHVRIHLEQLCRRQVLTRRLEEHTSELQSLMRNSYAVSCLKKKKICK